MYRHRMRPRLSPRVRRQDRRLGAVSDEDLVLLFDESVPAPTEAPRAEAWRGPAVAEGDGPADPAEDEVVLTLGGARTVVNVRPEPPNLALGLGSHGGGTKPSLPVAGDSPGVAEAASCRPSRLEASGDADGVGSPPVGALVVGRSEPGSVSSTSDLSAGRRRRFERRVGTRSVKGRFSWRRLFASAAVSGGLGSAALLVLDWIVG